jgi:hypothetical protein
LRRRPSGSKARDLDQDIHQAHQVISRVDFQIQPMSIPILLLPLTWWFVAALDTNPGWKSDWWEEDAVYSGLTSPDILHAKLSQHPGLGTFSLEFQRAWEASQYRFLSLEQPRITGPSASLVDNPAPVFSSPSPQVPPHLLVGTTYTEELIRNPIGPSTNPTHFPITPAEGVSNSRELRMLRFLVIKPTDSEDF